ncbi:MAG: hypothetical protein JXX14_05745 [Deltaproteobacteria bacterium]|nr:hypothetical protein [Deltaproteobacteria bacterium]
MHLSSSGIPIFPVVILLCSSLVSACTARTLDATTDSTTNISATALDSRLSTVSDDALLARADGVSRLNATVDELQSALQDYDELGRRIHSGESSFNSYDVHWRQARALFLLQELTSAKAPKMTWITAGEQAAAAAMADCSICVEGYYYAAVLKGRRAEHSGIGFKALKLVKEVLALGKKAAQIDASFDNAAPLRLLAMLYASAPSWPTSVGDIDLALETAERAIQISDYPMNHLIMAEVLLADEAINDARRELQRVLSAPIGGRWADESGFWRPYAEKLLTEIAD